MTASVLIPSFRRPQTLRNCLAALANQTRPAEEIIVAWQGDDFATRDAAEAFRDEHALASLKIVHSAVRGVVSAENAALDAASGEIIVLIDDDAVASSTWLARHLSFYEDKTVGAVGGPAMNHRPDGTPFPTRTIEPVGRLTWLGRTKGNTFDQHESWLGRPPIDVDHLTGYNMSLRRSAFTRFCEPLREYWQLFELEACLQVKSAGFRILFDFSNRVDHYPTNTAFVGGRDGDLAVKIYNPAFNQAYVLSKHTRSPLQRVARLAFLLMVGSIGSPGLVASVVAMKRYGRPAREMAILRKTLSAKLAGWRRREA